jgi:hypothetical protein
MDVYFPAAAGLGLAVVLYLLGKAASSLDRDRLAAFAWSLAFCLGWNAVPGSFPTDPERFGYGMPRRFWYDPAYRHKGPWVDQKAETAIEHWRFDRRAGLIDLAAAAAVIALGMVLNEVWQTAHGRRPRRGLDEPPDPALDDVFVRPARPGAPL